MINSGLFTSMKQNWRTPKKLYQELDKEFHFDFDPCIVDDKATMQSNGLYVDWGKSNFVNPPYNNIAKWVAKSYQEYKKGNLVVLLIPSRTDTQWWHNYCMLATEIRFIKGRLCFNDNGKPAPFPSAIIIFNPEKVALNVIEKRSPTLFG